MKIRISHPGANFKDMAYFTIILTSLLPETPGQSKQASIQRALQDLARECLDQLRKDNVPLLTSLLDNYSQPHAVTGHPSHDVAGHSYDSVWCGFPAIDLFEPPEIPILPLP